jgi:hypothetical protein
MRVFDLCLWQLRVSSGPPFRLLITHVPSPQHHLQRRVKLTHWLIIWSTWMKELYHGKPGTANVRSRSLSNAVVHASDHVCRLEYENILDDAISPKSDSVKKD